MRTPAFPTSVLGGLYAADDVAAALRDALRNDAALRGTIALATPSLSRAVEEWTSREHRSSDASVATSALAYVVRSTTRPTPLAACAAVSLANVDASAVTTLRCAAELQRRSRPDAEWVYGLAHERERTIERLPALRVRPSGAVYSMHGRLVVADVARAAPRAFGSGSIAAPAAIPTALNATPAVTAVLDAARGGATVEAIAERVAPSLGASPDEVVALVARLTELGVLVTDLRVPLTADPGAALSRALHECDPAVAAGVDALREALADADAHPLAGAPARLDAAEKTAGDVYRAEHVVQIDARRALTGTVGSDVTGAVARALGELFRITPQRSRNRAIAQAFSQRYNPGREVPLLQLLDAGEGLHFEEALDVQPTARQQRRDDVLLACAAEAIAAQRWTVELGERELAALREPLPDDAVLPIGYEIIAPVVKDGDRVVPLLTATAGEGMYRSLARFHDLFDGSAMPAPPEREDSIAAELVVLPHRRRAANVAIRAPRRRYEVVCGVTPGVDAEHVVTLDDLLVGVRDDRVYVRSRRLGKTVRVEQNHLLNPHGSSRVETFFAAIASSDVAAIGFSWGAAAGRLPFRSRVMVAGAVVALASWNVPRVHAVDFDDDGARAWRALWRVPRYVYLTFADNRLLLDLTQALCIGQIKRAAAKLGDESVVMLEEAYPFFGDEPVFDEAGRGYFAELAISLRVDDPRAGAGAIAPPDAHETPRSTALRPPGSEWVYAKLYVAAEYVDYFLEREIAPFLNELRPLAQDAFFMRYRDPDHHVRLRVRSERAHDVLAVTARRMRRWVEDGVLERAAFDTYDREVERYGGPGAIALAETCFARDSDLVLASLSGLRRTDDRDQALLSDVVAFVAACSDDVLEARAWLRRVTARRGSIDPASWERIRRCRRDLAPNPALGPVADAVRHLRSHLRPAVADGVLRALLHMHCNRLGVTVEEEGRLLDLAGATLDGLAARRAAEPVAAG